MTSRNDQTTYMPCDAQNVAFTGAPTNAAAIGDDTRIVRLLADQDCHVVFTGTATVNDMKLAAGIPEYFSIHDKTVISVISAGTNGTLNITEMDQ